MGKSHRPQRLGEEIRKIVSEMILKGELKDPRFTGMIGISDVDVTRDASYATLYITCISYGGKSLDEAQKQAILDAFEHSQGFIRSQIGKELKIRYSPALVFKFDESFEYGAKMDQILDKLDIKPEEPEDADNEQVD